MDKKIIIEKIREKKAIISDMDEFPYKPHFILEGVNEIVS